MNKQIIDGWEVFEFHCVNCGWISKRVYVNPELTVHITCPVLYCESIYKYVDGDLIFIGRTEKPFFKEKKHAETTE